MHEKLRNMLQKNAKKKKIMLKKSASYFCRTKDLSIMTSAEILIINCKSIEYGPVIR